MFMKRSELHERQCSTFVSCIVILISIRAVIVVGVADFKPNLPSTILVQQGNSAVFPWDYTVDNKLLEFDSLSPRWSYYNSSGYELRIGQENRIKNWAWEITNETCPKTLLNPVVRVSKTSVATLIIQNVGLEDAGIYGCTLVLSSPKTSKMRLSVSVTPQINLNETKHILEHYNLTVTCSANGPPTPNVTWIRNGNELAFGANGSAVLKIYRIKRYQRGKYYCKANNNPKEMSVVKEIDIIVQYPVECNETHSSKLVTAYLGQEIKLKTVADGVPIPTHVWYSPKKMEVYSEDLKESTYTIPKLADKDFGNWTINITNGIHSYYCVLTIEVKKVKAPPKGVKGLHAGEIAGIVIGVLAGIGIIAVIVVVIYKKKKKSG